MIDINIQKNLNGANGIMAMDIELHIKKSEFVIISGDSGSGKTTLLRCLAGLEKCKGTIKVNNTIWQDKNTNLKIQKRNIGFVFQDDALFTNMCVEQNLLYVNNDKNLANRLLSLTNMTNLKNSMPQNLSGGQKQRVSICRALMSKPDILLLDEPFSALDISIKSKLYTELLNIHKEFNLTTLMVSHDINEVYTLCSRNIQLNDANIIEDKSIKDILNTNKNDINLNLDYKIIDIKDDFAIININNNFVKIKID